MDIANLQKLASIVTPFALAWSAAIQSRLNGNSAALVDIERKLLQMRVDIQREAVGRHEIERLNALITHLIEITERTNDRVERIAERVR